MDKDLLNTLRDLLAEKTVGTQEEIRGALHRRGFEVNQSKISRTLRKIGAIKTVDENGQTTYSLP